MTDNQILQLIDKGSLPDGQLCEELVTTHISWVIICQDFVYKIKKPVKLSFVDFSTLEKRKHFCGLELSLNQRLTSNMYLDVLPVTVKNDLMVVGSGVGKLVDYALMMKRMDNSREMSKLLLSGGVTSSDVLKIARQLVEFHQTTNLIKGKVTSQVLVDDFNDILQIQQFVNNHYGAEAVSKLLHVVNIAKAFIDTKTTIIEQRDEMGFSRDCHGDLHSGNIFLLEEPVIFDCIEFNEHLRQIDILNELAFFCMDLEFHQQSGLSKLFMKAYNQSFRVIKDESEEQLFLFYKLYRANVKCKVNAIKSFQSTDTQVTKSRNNLFKRYFDLMLLYAGDLEKCVS